mgnify:FL=1
MIDKPLAYRRRPDKLEEVIGQKKIVSFLEKLKEASSLLSMVFYGPPGTGKTTLAKAFANSRNVNSLFLNAVLDKKEKREKTFEEAIRFAPSIVIIDEIHRLDKAKQDLLLPHLENGDFYLIGCTTANPLISLNPAIRSRCRLLQTIPLTEEEIKTGLIKALTSPKGLDGQRKFSDEAINYLAKISGGDFRFAYNQLEAVALSYSKEHLISLQEAKEVANRPNYLSDKDGDEHYDTVSAFQKSIRGSEVDAAIYYLAKLLKGGDLEGLIRRLMVIAYEDVGLANPQAVGRCYDACQVAREVGLPEAALPLSFTVTELALSPKSRGSADAIETARATVSDEPCHVRSYLRLKTYGTSKEESYPYDDKEVWYRLEYLPEGREDLVFYHGWDTGKYERALNEYRKLSGKKRVTDRAEAKRLAALDRAEDKKKI